MLDMSFHVQGQVITSGKSSFTEVALEGLHACVFPVVPGELVRPGKLPVTAVPGAGVRLLARVRSLVRLQVGALGVHLKYTHIIETGTTQRVRLTQKF